MHSTELLGVIEEIRADLIDLGELVYAKSCVQKRSRNVDRIALTNAIAHEAPYRDRIWPRKGGNRARSGIWERSKLGQFLKSIESRDVSLTTQRSALAATRAYDHA
jgi:hypothetical protein